MHELGRIAFPAHQTVNVLGLLHAEERDDAKRPAGEALVRQDGGNFGHDGFGLGLVAITTRPRTVGYVQVDQRRVDALGEPRNPQWRNRILVEVTVGIGDDGRHATEMLS